MAVSNRRYLRSRNTNVVEDGFLWVSRPLETHRTYLEKPRTHDMLVRALRDAGLLTPFANK